MKRNLDYNKLEQLILKVMDYLNRPIMKEDLIKLVTELFVTNSTKNVEFCINSMTINDKLFQKDDYIYHKHWDGKVTSADMFIPKYLISLKEDAIEYCDSFFSSQKYLKVEDFFYFVNRFYVGLLNYEDTANEYFQHIFFNCRKSIKNLTHAEFNDNYPGWFTTFFNRKDCRVLIRNICELHSSEIKINLILVPGKKGGYSQAHTEYLQFKKYIDLYLEGPYKIKTELLVDPKKGV